jgi:hypothetical protein
MIETLRMIAIGTGLLFAWVVLMYFGAKAARYGWLQAEELFRGRRLERNRKEMPCDEEE